MDFTDGVGLDCNLTTAPEAKEAYPPGQSLDNDIGGPGNQKNPNLATELNEMDRNSQDDKFDALEEGDDKKLSKESDIEMTYSLEDIPPWYACLLFGFQQQMSMFGGVITMPFLAASMLCVQDDVIITGQIFSTAVLMASFATFLQTTFGVRLPILQGPSPSLYFPALVFLSLPQWKCQTDLDLNSNFSVNGTEVDWKDRMREVQGALMVASAFEFLLGISGAIGLLLRFIGPLTVAPIIVMIGLGMYDIAALFASGHWGIAFLTVALIVLFSQYLRKVPLPIPAWSKQQRCHFQWLKIFEFFPVILGICLAWLTCYILTITEVFPEGSAVRTDLKTSAVREAPWVLFPLPGQWGTPRVSLPLVLGMFCGILASIVESVGDYHACARFSGAPPPPPHAVNRGICMEGFCCFLAGIWGSGLGPTSYSENIGAIAITKVGSRRVMQWTSLLLFICAVFGKFGAVLATLPLPIIGGALIAVFSMIISVGVSNVQFVNMNASRSLCVFGLSVFCGLMVPNWISENPDAINTGNAEADDVLMVLLTTGMFVAGIVGFFLDNTIPGTAEDRGLIRFHADKTSKRNDRERCYDLPWCTSKIRGWKWSRYIPICPGFLDKRE
ncbi:solute carrier family 23 member 1-like [Ptychodera flava]|uniref:solute carrier family 23 member 1-like n=1 Tax=Ptychodera flava TaxID=63121 RepID=UPI003969D49D